MITFFVSSTFRDMAGEREALHKEILPRVNKEVRRLGEYVSICDLRWGVDTGEEDAGDAIVKVMEVCARSIDNCRPYMLIFLGDYYGTVPELSAIKKCLDDHDIQSPAGFASMSVTQFEIEYGIFPEKMQPADQSICCIRKLDTQSIFQTSEEDYRHMEDLKKRLYERKDVLRIDYEAAWNPVRKQTDGLEDLQARLQEAMTDIVKRQHDAHRNLNWIEQEFWTAQSFCTRKQDTFGGRARELEELQEKIRSADYTAIGVWGDSGIGKSGLLSKLYEALCQDGHCHVCFIACGYGERSHTYLDVLRQIDYFINSYLFYGEDSLSEGSKKNGEKGGTGKGNEDGKGSWREDLKRSYLRAVNELLSEEKGEELLKKDIEKYEYIGMEKLVIFVDALDKLSSINEIRLLSLFAEKAGSKLTMVCSQAEAFLKEGALEKKAGGICTVRLNPLSGGDIRDIFEKNTASHGRHVQDMAAAFQKKRDVSPLKMMIAVSILKMHLADTCGKSEDEIYDDFQGRIEQLPPELPAVCWNCIEEAGKYLDVRLYQEIAGLIAVTRRGIRESDLEAILSGKWKSAEFARLCLYLSEFFYCGEQGKWNFSHDLMKEGVLKHMHCKRGGRSEEEALEGQLFSYLESKEKNDEVRISEGLFLCAKRNDTAFALRILEEAAGSEEKMDHTLAVRTLWEILETDSGKSWYEACVQADPICIARLLERGLRFTGAADYTRRYPSYELAKIFWEKRGMRLLDTFDRLPEGERDVLFHLCVEYVGILDDISQNEYSLPFTGTAVSVIENTEYGSLSTEQKRELFRCANLIFFPNNRLVGFITKGNKCADILTPQEKEQAGRYSRDIFRWYQKFIEPERELFSEGETLGKFLNNVGQYYNAVKEYDRAFPYRMKSLKHKCTAICKNMGTEFPEWPDAMKNEAESLAPHIKFWEKFLTQNGQRLKAQIKKESKAGRNTARNQWNAIGVTYRTSASDHYALAEESAESAEKNLELSRKELELCLWFQRQEFLEGLDKEVLVTGVRWIGTAAWLAEITGEIPEGAGQIVDMACGIARRLYRNEQRECEMLLKNCRKLADAAGQDKALQTRISYRIGQLDEDLAIYHFL